MSDKFLILAPHGDDEIIGCSQYIAPVEEYLTGDGDEPDYDLEVWYMEDPNPVKPLPWRHKVVDLKDLSSELLSFLTNNTNVVILAPDFINERHPVHKAVGGLAYYTLQAYKSFTLGLYTTQMDMPYVKLHPLPRQKRRLLDTYYLNKSDLWEYEHKYFLYEAVMFIQ